MLCGHILGRSFTPAFEQMRLDNTASIACGTFVQIRTQIPRPSMPPYRHMSGIKVSIIVAGRTISCEIFARIRASNMRAYLPRKSEMFLPRQKREMRQRDVAPKKSNKAKQNRILQASPLKCAVRIFRMSEVKRANEGGKSEFLRVRRARNLDTLPQKERKPRLKKTILRRNRVPPQRAMVRYIRGVVFEWRGCRSKSEKQKGPNSNKLSEPFPFCFSLIPIRFAAPPPDPSSTRYKKGYCRRAR